MKIKTTSTVYEKQKKVIETQEASFTEDKERENSLLSLYPQMTYQKFEGFGGAATDSAGYVYSQMNQEQKDALLKSYFTEEGFKYQHIRISLDSCDFALECYEAMSDPDDVEMLSFTMERTAKYIYPLLDDIEKMAGRSIPLMVSPWSPPAFMKTNGKRIHGGKLKDEYKDFWAAYICRFIKELMKKGYRVEKLSLQNEPKAVQTWDSCIYSAAEERLFLKDHLYPALCKNHLENIEVFIWDHNKERVFERACELIDNETDHMIAGIAFHWYSGDHFEALQMVRERFPDKKLILSEACIEFTKFSEDNFLENAQKYAHDIIGNLNHGMTGFFDWNILLDEQGGPNHVGNYCDAPYRFDIEKGELQEGTIAEYLRHFCHYISPGAVRIGFSRYTDEIEMTALRNTDGSLVIVLLNRTDREIESYIRIEDSCAKIKVKPLSIMTGVVCSE